MSLATRCAACGTTFRVVQDQLKVSEGWVRCGRCNEVFNALEGLFDLERDLPSQWPSSVQPTEQASEPAAERAPQPPAPPAEEPLPPRPTDTRSAAQDFDDEPAEDHDPSLVDKIDAQLLSPRRTGFGALASLAPAQRQHEDFADARFNTELVAESGPDLSLEPSSAEPDSEPESAETPEFVRRAESAERWRGSRARSLLLACCAVLTIALVLQVAHQFRDRIAAQWPVLEPSLAAWCRLASCRLEAPRHIDGISVESSSLTRSTALDAYTLSIVLRNRASLAVSLPWIDLSLTDTAGQLVARRTLSPKDFDVSAQALPAEAELPMQLTLSSAGGRIAGYTVEVFYP